MRDDEYYKAIAKTAENWRRQNIFALQEIARGATRVQPAYISMLRDLEKSMVGFRTMQEQIQRGPGGRKLSKLRMMRRYGDWLKLAHMVVYLQ